MGQGHILRGKYDTSIDILSASVTLLWGGPQRGCSTRDTGGNSQGDHPVPILDSLPDRRFRKHQLRGDISDRPPALPTPAEAVQASLI